MQKIFQFSFVVGTVVLMAACSGKTTSTEIQKEKQMLADLKKQQQKINQQISDLENKLAQHDTAFANTEKAKLVVLTTVAPQTFIHFINLQGRVDAVNIAYVAPKGTGGVVKALYVKKGDKIHKGQLLLQLDDAIAQQSFAAAQQNIETVQTQLAFAKTLYQKQKNLWDQNIGTEVQLITAKNNVENLQNQLATLQKQLNITKQQLDYTKVYAEIDGVADDVNVRVGELFTGFSGTSPQIKIVNTNNLKVTTQVPENYLGKVIVGSPVKITLPDINKTIDATISVTGNLIDANNRSFFAEAKLPSGKEFYPNQVAVIAIQDYKAMNAITAPINTIQNDENGKYVLVAAKEGNRLIAIKRHVKIGMMNNDNVEILSGLQAGDQIITDGYQSLYDGQLITTQL
ncbi:MAG: efflux RND transporter periplasmic adaptor subunit [Hydrotalea flava]|uniref:efflux RND transporter periplasmic adaptor subunit n=1 Tax=Hydrotalea lipotrueae TaxID=2803817 RepID=UPI00169FCFAA|nr:efflux RND transporter periplasmic adaptor subunit [Hydrotalea lipotrueae]NIM35699.1 efflux RND transporter periplasmic adaptor subunit [Hydrotalea flava]NIM38558.1 efflux RND transporter periplasmic adaptor subunit [Hydrotalea flava]NIN03735.1 efflux RND transporter periplasmic adaptor subunit [Hydrotalea flava]NIN15436.1 efflux RND transporter periplasmic adaptor subunit [Hydrotalea flava]NIO94484.1 efflux RND transporter periplasmic adaptor subunit [Hydrotalea flava]